MSEEGETTNAPGGETPTLGEDASTPGGDISSQGGDMSTPVEETTALPVDDVTAETEGLLEEDDTTTPEGDDPFNDTSEEPTTEETVTQLNRMESDFGGGGDRELEEPKESDWKDDIGNAATGQKSGASALFDKYTIIAMWTIFCTIRILLYSITRQFPSTLRR